MATETAEKGGGQATATATATAARAMATMVASNKEGNGNGGMGNGNKGGGQAAATRAKATAIRAMATVAGVACNKEARVRMMPKAMMMTRVVGNKEGKGIMAIATVKRVVGKQLQWQRGWQARKRARSAWAMAMATKRQQQDDDETTTRQRDDDETTTR